MIHENCDWLHKNKTPHIIEPAQSHHYCVHTFPLFMKSNRRPGVATIKCAPDSTQRNWYPTDVPPYSTTGLIPVP